MNRRNAHLTESQVVEIRRRFATWRWRSRWQAAEVMALEYGVKPHAIYYVIIGKAWQMRPRTPVGELKPGQEFGFLRVVRRVYAPAEKNSRYLVECFAPSKPDGSPCGRQKEVARCSLVSGDTRSCICMKGKLWRVETKLVRERLRAPSRRCPECFKSKALRGAVVLVGEEFQHVGMYCRYCQRITVEADSRTPAPSARAQPSPS